MTTSKPEVVAWVWDYRGRHMATTDYSKALELAEPPYPTEVEPLIRLADYERLQADHKKLISYTQNGIECFANPCPEHSGINTPPFSEFQERYGHLCLMCVVDERDALRAECKKLVEALELAQGFLRNQGYSEEDPLLLGAINAALAAASAVQGEVGEGVPDYINDAIDNLAMTTTS